MGVFCPLNFIRMEADLLKLVQPTSGYYAVVGIKEKKDVRQHLVATREELDRLSAQFVREKRNVFFGVAKYKTPDSRLKSNVLALKAFWLDIDCGADKATPNPETGIPEGYIDQTAGLVALQKFCKTIGLPKPTIVNSGRGVHVYWALTDEVSREVWEPVAERIRELCTIHEFYIDRAVFEVARVLRVPGTYNFKGDTPKLVEVVSFSPPITISDFRKILGVSEKEPEPEKPKRGLTALGKAMLGNIASSFSKIMLRSAKGTGCAQLLSCYQNRSTLPEGQWFNALSIAKFCSDRDTAIHKISFGHPEYDYHTVEQKVRHIAGPHSCIEFEKHNPKGCDGCPHRGKITTPIQLGKELLEATEQDRAVEVQDEDGTEATTTYKIPDYPEPFFRGKNGGIYYMPTSDEEEPVHVYEHDLYVLKRMNDPVAGDVIVLRLHLPRDGVKEFTVTNAQITDKAELRKILSREGVMCPDKKFALLTMYLYAVIRELQFKRKAEMMRTQFGWAERDSKFILGDREISKDGIFHSPPSATTKEIADFMIPVGTLMDWKAVFKLYGRKGLEPHAFGALTAFGSPLFKFLGYKGCIINVIHPSSGTGKSTILHMCNSVFGHPEGLCAIFKDTTNSKMHRLGVMNNLTYTLDEITNIKAAEFSDLVYSMSQGRGKDRMQGSANAMRANLTNWACMSLCSSNASFYEKLSAMKSSPDGEFMRLLEYKIESTPTIIPATEAKTMFDHQLKNNYGWAGEIYAQWLVNNLEEAKRTALNIQRKIDSELRLTGRERYWSAALACNITGGLIAKQLELIDWDMKAIYAWATTMLNEIRQDVEPASSSISSVIGDYINRHMQNILVVQDSADKRSAMQTLPLLEPRGELLIRYEPDTKRMYLAAKAFKDDCVEYQVNYKETLRKLQETGIYLGSEAKRLSKGMKVVSPGVHSIVLNCASVEFFDTAQLAQQVD